MVHALYLSCLCIMRLKRYPDSQAITIRVLFWLKSPCGTPIADDSYLSCSMIYADYYINMVISLSRLPDKHCPVIGSIPTDKDRSVLSSFLSILYIYIYKYTGLKGRKSDDMRCDAVRWDAMNAESNLCFLLCKCNNLGSCLRHPPLSGQASC